METVNKGSRVANIAKLLFDPWTLTLLHMKLRTNGPILVRSKPNLEIMQATELNRIVLVNCSYSKYDLKKPMQYSILQRWFCLLDQNELFAKFKVIESVKPTVYRSGVLVNVLAVRQAFGFNGQEY